MQPITGGNNIQIHPGQNQYVSQGQIQIAQQQYKTVHYGNQIIVGSNQQIRPQSVSPVEGKNYVTVNQQPMGSQPQFYSPNNANVVYNVHPLSPQPQRSVVQFDHNQRN